MRKYDIKYNFLHTKEMIEVRRPTRRRIKLLKKHLFSQLRVLKVIINGGGLYFYKT